MKKKRKKKMTMMNWMKKRMMRMMEESSEDILPMNLQCRVEGREKAEDTEFRQTFVCEREMAAV